MSSSPILPQILPISSREGYEYLKKKLGPNFGGYTLQMPYSLWKEINMPFHISVTSVNQADELTPYVVAEVHDMFTYHKWDPEQIQKGEAVRAALEQAFLVIIQNVPPSPDRSAAFRKLREARMDCNSAITHKGKY